MTLWAEEGRSDVRVSLRELMCVISVTALLSKTSHFLFLSASWLACNRGQAGMERPRYGLQVMLQGMARVGESREVLVDQL